MRKEKLNVVAVSYLNTKPLLYALRKSVLAEQINLRLEIPSRCAALLENGEADLGLVPVATLPFLEQPVVISDYCIGCVGEVATVCLVGDRPLSEWTTVYLDFHSRSSVQLTKILFREYWKKEVVFLDAQEGYIDQIGGTTGGLIIGDRAFNLENQFDYVYDLGTYWQKHTGLPFVFAAWVSRVALEPSFIAAFNAVLKTGIDHIPALLKELDYPSSIDLPAYFQQHISYTLDDQKKKALSLFLTKIGTPSVQFA